MKSAAKVKVGIIGAGWIAYNHAAGYLTADNTEIVGVADPHPEKAEKLAARFGLENVHYYPDHLSMLKAEHLDAVSVCTYNSRHADCSIDAMRHGAHVICEKPMSVTMEEAVEMCRVEKETGRILMIGFQPRMDANMQEIKKIVQSGRLGDIYYIQTGGGRRRGIPTPYGTTFIEKRTAGMGALADIGCYSLDMVLHAVGYPKPLTASGYTSAFFGKRPGYYPAHPEYAEKFEVDDFAAAFVRLEGGIVLDFRIAWAMNLDTPGDTIILGTEAGLRIPSTECWSGTIGGPMTLYYEKDGQQREEIIPLHPDSQDRSDRKMRAFVEAVRTGGPSPIDSAEILYNQAILCAIQESAALGREVEIKVPEI